MSALRAATRLNTALGLKMKEVQRGSEGWMLLEAETGGYVLSVPTRVGELRIPLNDHERNEYMIAGTVYLELMAGRVVDRPEAYRARSI